MAQSDGLVRLTILSADGHPKGARGHELSRSQQLPTAVSPPKKLRLLFAPFFTGNLVEKKKKKKNPYFFKTRKLTGFSGEFFDFEIELWPLDFGFSLSSFPKKSDVMETRGVV